MRCPHMEERNGQKTLVVKGQPFIMLAGEVHNSNYVQRAHAASAEAAGIQLRRLP